MWFLSCEGRAFNKMQITGGRMLAFQRWNLQLDRWWLEPNKGFNKPF